jgi:hypothetical protein
VEVPIIMEVPIERRIEIIKEVPATRIIEPDVLNTIEVPMVDKTAGVDCVNQVPAKSLILSSDEDL